MTHRFRIDALQYANWSDTVFDQMRQAEMDAVHVTIAYHEDFRETVDNIIDWTHRFEAFSDRIQLARTADDVRMARQSGRTAIVFGLQTPAPIEDDIGLVKVLHDLGVRFMQLTYNNQSLLATGCYEADDSGVTRMGRAVIREMNRVGLVIDMSHSSERSTLETIDLSARPIAITHANPSEWHDVPRNKSSTVIKALADRGGMLGFSLYPHHLAGGSACTLEAFCGMVARTADLVGPAHLGIGSDLCQDQPDSVVAWMRDGRWHKPDPSRQDATPAVFPPQPDWFRDNRDFPGLADGLAAVGFDTDEIAGILGDNWMRFFDTSFGPMS